MGLRCCSKKYFEEGIQLNTLLKNIYSIFDLVFGIKPKEFKIVNLFLFYLTIIYTAYTVISTSALSLFLGRIDSETLHNLLPWLYIAIALVVTIVAKVYQAFIDKFSRIKLIVWTTILFIFSFLILRMLIYTGKTWVYALLMIWDETSCVILIMVFYSFLGDYFYVHNARRLFAYITGGMALGAPIGGFGSAFLLNYISTSNLIYIGVLLHATALIFAYSIYSNNLSTKEITSHIKKIKNPILPKKLFFNKYLCLVFLVGAFPIVCACIDSYQMAYIASKTLTEKELGSFMGKFYGYAGLMLLVIDFVFAKWIQKQNVITNLFIMPILLAFSCIAFIVNPILIFAASIKFVDNVLTNTVNTFAFQVLFLPLSERVRMHAQAMSAGVMTSGAKILGGAILVVLSFFYIPIQVYTFIILLITLIWIVITLFLAPLYKNELATSISKINSKFIDFETIINHPKSNEVINEILSSNNNNNIIALLQALRSKSFQKYKDAIEKLLTHPDPIIAMEALNTYGLYGDFKNIQNLLPNVAENLVLKTSATFAQKESIDLITAEFLDEKNSDSKKNISLIKMTRLNSEKALIFILKEINSFHSFVLMAGAYHALTEVHCNKVSVSTKEKIQETRDKVFNKIIILRQAYEEMRDISKIMHQFFTESIYFYTSVFCSLLSIEYNIKEMAQLKNLVINNNQTNIHFLLELLETVVPSDLAKKYKKILEPLTELKFTSDKPKKETLDKLLAVDLWINSLTLYALQGQKTMNAKNSIYLDYIETILFLKQVSLFKEIPVNFLSPIAENVYEQHYNSGDCIFKQGENSYSLFIIKSGSVKIQTDTKEIITLKAGESFGELALLENLSHSASAFSLEQTTVFRLDSDSFSKILDMYPEVSKALLKILAYRLRIVASDG